MLVKQNEISLSLSLSLECEKMISTIRTSLLPAKLALESAKERYRVRTDKLCAIDVYTMIIYKFTLEIYKLYALETRKFRSLVRRKADRFITKLRERNSSLSLSLSHIYIVPYICIWKLCRIFLVVYKSKHLSFEH